MLMKMEKKDSSTQTKSNIGPCRVHSCRGYTRSHQSKGNKFKGLKKCINFKVNIICLCVKLL